METTACIRANRPMVWSGSRSGEKNVVGGLHVLGGLLGRPTSRRRSMGRKTGGEAVRLIGVVRRGAEDGGLGLKARPGAQGEADVAAVGVNP